MKTISFPFEEIPLVLGNYSAEKPLAIALISGRAEISYSRVQGDDGAGFEFDIEGVQLSAPIAGWGDVTLKWIREGAFGREMWNCICRSIERARTDEIFEAIAEAAQPDPDAQYEARRDDRRFG